MSAFMSKFLGMCSHDPLCFREKYMPTYRTAGLRPLSGFSLGAWISCLWAPTGWGVRVVRTTNKVQKWMRETLSHPSPGLFGSVRAAEKYFFVTGRPKNVSPFRGTCVTHQTPITRCQPQPQQHSCIPSSQPDRDHAAVWAGFVRGVVASAPFDCTSVLVTLASATGTCAWQMAQRPTPHTTSSLAQRAQRSTQYTATCTNPALTASPAAHMPSTGTDAATARPTRWRCQ